jgi:uncharacterized protein YndB with AHSA1/START domain
MTASVIVSVRVGAPAEEAFRIFVEEIGEWWIENPLFRLTPRGDGSLRFDPGESGRLISLLPSGGEFEIGRVTHWAPGERLAFTWRAATFSPEQLTTVDVRFESFGEETRVTVTHRGWDLIPQEHVARHGFPLGVFQQRLAESWREQLRRIRGIAGSALPD